MYRDRKWTSGCLEFRGGYEENGKMENGYWLLMGTEFLSGVQNCNQFDHGDVLTHCGYTKKHWIMHVKWTLG